jgi:hypothetical protein
MPLIGFSIVIQVLCAIHCMRSGANRTWLMIIIFLSLPGCFAYAILEILPQYTGSRQARLLKSAAIRKLDPERDVRIARESLALADTAANRIALADALVETEAYPEALGHYEEALRKAPSPDRTTQFKLARATLEGGNPADACKLLEALPASGSASENDRAALYLARAWQELGESEKALALYEDIGQRLPGGEAQCRQALLLIQVGRAHDAQPILEEVQRRVKRIDRHERAANAQMYDWAERTLSEIRTV